MDADDMNKNVEESEASKSPVVTPIPWYRAPGILIVLTVVLSVLAFVYLFYRPVAVNRGPWQVLDPGRPVEPLKFEVVQEGTGAVVEPGDLILVSMWFWSRESNEIEQRNDDWWIWVGFRTEKETLFHSINPSLLSAFVGQRERGEVRFLEPSYRSGIYAGKVYVNPFGDFGSYSRVRSEYRHKSRSIYTPTSTGYTVVHIKKVFKGQLRYRTNHLRDGTWFVRCRWWGAESGVGCNLVRDRPREGWYDEARYDGVSVDGKQATFQYGPVSTPGEPWRHPSGNQSIINWREQEWASLPVGVRVR
jgi:hypothetical protein